MFKCEFIKYLWKDSDTKRLYKTLERKLVLPFVPVLGLEVAEGEWFSGKIERIVWSNTDEVFTVKVMDIKPKEGVTAELLLDIAEKQGWSTRV